MALPSCFVFMCLWSKEKPFLLFFAANPEPTKHYNGQLLEARHVSKLNTPPILRVWQFPCGFIFQHRNQYQSEFACSPCVLPQSKNMYWGMGGLANLNSLGVNGCSFLMWPCNGLTAHPRCTPPLAQVNWDGFQHLPQPHIGQSGRKWVDGCWVRWCLAESHPAALFHHSNPRTSGRRGRQMPSALIPFPFFSPFKTDNHEINLQSLNLTVWCFFKWT